MATLLDSTPGPPSGQPSSAPTSQRGARDSIESIDNVGTSAAAAAAAATDPATPTPTGVAAPGVAARNFSSRAASALSSLRFLASAFPAGSEGPNLPQFEPAPRAAANTGPRASTSHPTTATAGREQKGDDDSQTRTSVTAGFVIKLAVASGFLVTVWLLSVFGVLPSWESVWPVLACWLPVEIFWALYFRAVVTPRLARFRPEDAGQPLEQAKVDRVIDDIVYLIRRDPAAFWSQATGLPAEEFSQRRVPIATARSFIRSMFMVFPEMKDQYEGDPAQNAMLLGALERLEEASGGFDHDSHGDADGGDGEFEASVGGDNWDSGGGHLTSLSHPTLLPVPNLLRGWHDDEHLKAMIRSPPLAVILGSGCLMAFVFAMMWLFGWRRAFVDPETKLECWVWTRSPKSGTQDYPHLEHKNPLVMIPGAGAGLFSFLPLAAQVQFGGAAVARGRVVLYRLPWAEICRLRYRFPQWSAVLRGLLESLDEAGVKGAFDLVAHSYGTVVTNRLLRHLCQEHDKASAASAANAGTSDTRVESDCTQHAMLSTHGEAEEKKQDRDPSPRLRIDFLALLDPIVLGSATTGIIGQVNHAGPDLSFGFCCNRAGVSTLEILNYDPQASGQCASGLAVYVSQDDTLVDIGLARHILRKYTRFRGNTGNPPNFMSVNANGNAACHPTSDIARRGGVEFVVDNTPKSFHGRWLVEMWGMGHLWGSPCASRLVDMLNPRLGLVKARAMTKLRAAMRLKTQAKVKAL